MSSSCSPFIVNSLIILDRIPDTPLLVKYGPYWFEGYFHHAGGYYGINAALGQIVPFQEWDEQHHTVVSYGDKSVGLNKLRLQKLTEVPETDFEYTVGEIGKELQKAPSSYICVKSEEELESLKSSDLPDKTFVKVEDANFGTVDLYKWGINKQEFDKMDKISYTDYKHHRQIVFYADPDLPEDALGQVDLDSDTFFLLEGTGVLNIRNIDMNFIFGDDFTDSSTLEKDYITSSSSWSIEDNALVQNSSADTIISVNSDYKWSNFEVELDVNLSGLFAGKEFEVGILSKDESRIGVELERETIRIIKYDRDGSWSNRISKSFNYKYNADFNLKCQFTGSNISAYVDGDCVLNEATDLAKGVVGTAYIRCKHLFCKVKTLKVLKLSD